jgi:putative multiple sugar transport system substrate-binding protein
MRTPHTAIAASASALVLTLTSCELESGESKQPEAATVGISMPTRASERWFVDGSSMVDQLDVFGYKAILQYADDDPDRQVSQLENMISRGVDALVIGAIDGRSLNGVLSRAEAADIPVIAYDRLILGSPHLDYYASFDNEKVGRLQATYIVEQLGLVNGSADGPFNIELFAGSSDDNNTRYFFEGAMKVLGPYIRSEQLIVKSGQTELSKITTQRWDGAIAKKRMANLLRSTYSQGRVDAVLSPYDGISLGILSALKADGYGSGTKPLPIVTGQDAEVPSIKSIIAGEQSMTVYKDTRTLALVTSDMVSAAINDNRPVVNDTRSYHNGKKAIPSYLLKPVSVDKNNYKQVLVHSGYIDQKDLDD